MWMFPHFLPFSPNWYMSKLRTNTHVCTNTEAHARAHTHIYTHSLTGLCIRETEWSSRLYFPACVCLFRANAEIRHATHFPLETMCLFMCFYMHMHVLCFPAVWTDFFSTCICPVWLSSISKCVCVYVCFFFWICPVSVSPDSMCFCRCVRTGVFTLPFTWEKAIFLPSHWLKEAEDKQLRIQQLQIGPCCHLTGVTTFTILVLPAADVFQDISRFEGLKQFWNMNTAETTRLIRTFLIWLAVY